jgi:flagellar biogenesis protein FliO
MLAFWLAQARITESDVSSVNNEIFDYLKMIVVLAGILVLAFLVLRFWLPRMTGLQGLSSGPIRIAARFPLEPRKNLYIVETASEYFLVGTSESGIHFLTALNSARLEAALEQARKPKPDADFSKFVRAFRRRQGSP